MIILMMTQNVAWRGGTFARCFNLAQGLVSLGHEVTLVAASQRRRLRCRASQVGDMTLIEMPGLFGTRTRHAGFDPLDILARLMMAFRLDDFDNVHTFDHRPSVIWPASLMIRRRGRVKLISDWCDLWGAGGLADLRGGIERWILGPLDAEWEARLHDRADGMTMVSEMLLRQAEASGHSPVLLLPPGADIEHISVHDRVEMRWRYGLPVDAPIIAYSGYTSNSIPLLADAFAHIAERVPDALLLIVGGHFPGLERLLESKGLAGRVKFTGVVTQDDLGSALACADVMILPLIEHAVNVAGFPNKLGDYMAAGRPVVANAVGDAGTFIEEWEIGTVAGLDADSLAEAAVGLLRDGAAYQRAAEKARLAAEANSWLVRAQTLEAFYNEFLASGR